MKRSLQHLRGVRLITNDARYHAKAKVDLTPQTPEHQLLYDTFGRKHNYLRISLTERCNLRCVYCMPAAGVPLSPKDHLLSGEETRRLTRVFMSMGVNKVRLTGGEPTLNRELVELVREASAAGAKVGITSNGVSLTRRLPALLEAGLAALNLSLDSLRADRYEALTRRPALRHVLSCLHLALQLEVRPLKINVVVMKGINEDEVLDFVEFTKDKDLEVRFIEFMPFAGNEWSRDRLVETRTLLRMIGNKYEIQPQASVANETSRVWEVKGHLGRIGFISSMTQPFCGGCNRLRLTADGKLKVCLFGSSEVCLRSAIREGADDEQLRAQIRQALLNKKKQHAGMKQAMGSRPMVLIGG